MCAKYGIKFYGFSDCNQDKLIRKIAVLFKITEAEAQSLMRNLPAMAAQGLEKSIAEEILRSLTSIKGLALLVAEDKESDPDLITGVPAHQFSRIQEEATSYKESNHTHAFWSALFLAALVVLLVFTVGGTLTSFKRLSEKHRTSEFVGSQNELHRNSQASSELPSSEEIRLRKENISDLRSELNLMEEDLYSDVNAFGAQESLIREKRTRVASARKRLKDELRKLDELKIGRAADDQ